jgi:hypothetical protein
MISNDVINSQPNTIQNNDNFLKDFVNTSGFRWDSTCLEVAFRNLGPRFNEFVQNRGDFNTVAASNPQFTQPRSWQEKDYSGPCPQGWTQRQSWQGGGCVNPFYRGPRNCFAGRTHRDPQQARCPDRVLANPPSWQNCRNNFSWNWWPSWRHSCTTTQNPNNYSGWNGPTDASQRDLRRTSIGNQPPGQGSLCTAGWAASNSLGSAQSDCNRSGGQWVQFWDDPGFWRNAYTCYTPTRFSNVTESASNFTGWNNDARRNWENRCSAEWPMVTRTTPGRWNCTYSTDSLENDIARGNIFQIGGAATPVDAARMILRSNRMVNNFFFMVGTSVFITGPNSNSNVFTSKGRFQPNCTERNNRRGTLFVITQAFFDMLQQCRVVNDNINSVNTNRDILQRAVTSIERFTPMQNIRALSNNENEVISNLTSDYNKKAELYNYQVDLLGRNEKLVEEHNKKLNQQLNDLTNIQDQIALKDRVIELNDDLTLKQIRNKKILIGFFVLIPFLGIPLLLIVTKAFSPFIGLSIAGLMIVGYIIYMVVVQNQSDKINFKKEDNRTISKYERSLSNYWNKQREALSRSLSEFVNGKCANGSQVTDGNTQEEEQQNRQPGSGSSNSAASTKDKYLLKSNGPFYYYDGSAPPQQIHPGAVGSIDFSVDGITDRNLKFPREIQTNINSIENPITRFFFQTWLSILSRNGINLNDSRFAQDLDVIDFPDSDDNPPPYWENIKLPIISNIQQQFDHLFSSLSIEKRDLSNKASSNLINIWNFVNGDKIPGDVYKTWVDTLAIVLEDEQPNIQKFYNDFLTSILGSRSINSFVDSKMKEFIKIINKDIHVSQPFLKKYI